MTTEELMQEAIAEAEKALIEEEVPIGAVVFDVTENKIIGRGYNRKEGSMDATTHAEMEAIRQACKNRGNWRLTDTLIVSTVEPCAMCVGAIIQARIPKVVYGVRDEKFGALGSVVDLRGEKWNHKFEVEEGIMEKECRELLQKFFEKLRE